ncbi:MAG TPA: TonB-dependent receptor [Steroidobacteraceae bacterium]|nr:TonB-dependent receptor [Steroidobacteraceae bacterium]
MARTLSKDYLKCALLIFSLVLVCVFQADMALAEEQLSIVQGVIVAASTSMPLEKATVMLGEKHSTTDAKGIFTLRGVTVGKRTLSIKADGYQSKELVVDVAAGINRLGSLALITDSVQLADVNVNATDSTAQIAFEDKMSTEVVTDTASAAALNNANSSSGADIAKDVSGVAVSKGAGGTSTVSVRGIDQRMLRITVDGQRQGGAGNPLDNIPAEIVQSLEVTKTFTPDMDADAVGGVININTGGAIVKDAYIQGRNQVTHNVLAPRPGLRNSLTLAQPFSLFTKEHNASVVVTGSFDDLYSRRERLSNLREWTSQVSPGPDPYTKSLVPVLTLPLIESSNEHRQRGGLVINSDARFGDLAVYLRSNMNRDWTHRDRRINDTDPAEGTPMSLTPYSANFSGVPLSRRDVDQTMVREAGNFSLGAKSKFNGNEWDVVAAYTLTHEDEPHTYESGFNSDDDFAVGYDLADPYHPRFSYLDETTPGDSAAIRDPSRYHLNYFSITDATLHEEDASLKFNLKLNWDTGNYLKFGGKVERRHRRSDIDRDYYNAGSQALAMTQVLNASQLALRTAPYDIGPVPSARLVNGLLTSNAAAFLLDPVNTSINSNTGDYAVTENMWALYAMGKYRLSRDWTLIGGVRVEGTKVGSTATQMNLDNTGALQGFDLANVNSSYTELLPSLHLRYDASPALVYRASITRSMSRPSNADIAPYRTLSFVDHRSRVGAPELKPYLATNLDFSVDHYDAKYGLVSFALFYKKIDHFITDAQYPVTIGNLGEFIEFKRINGDTALATGMELNWQGPQWNLPLKLGRGSLEANYSFNHGEAHHATRPGETFPLPRQVDHQGSVKFHEQHGALSVDASVNYRTGWWEDLIAKDFDNYINAAWEAEISGSYKLNKTARLTGGISNLLDRPTRHYAGIESRMNDWQRNGREFTLGLQWKM